MAKIMALDIGGRRTGIAETDPLQIIASPRETVATEQLEAYLQRCYAEEEWEGFVLGDPLQLDGGRSHNSDLVDAWEKKLRSLFPEAQVWRQDERFSSKMARQALISAGVKKQKRAQKGALDPVSAAIILRDFLAERL